MTEVLDDVCTVCLKMYIAFNHRENGESTKPDERAIYIPYSAMRTYLMSLHTRTEISNCNSERIVILNTANLRTIHAHPWHTTRAMSLNATTTCAATGNTY